MIEIITEQNLPGFPFGRQNRTAPDKVLIPQAEFSPAISQYELDKYIREQSVSDIKISFTSEESRVPNESIILTGRIVSCEKLESGKYDIVIELGCSCE